MVSMPQPGLWGPGPCACVCAHPLACLHVCSVLLCKWCAMFKVRFVDVRVGCVALALCACVGLPTGWGQGQGRG